MPSKKAKVKKSKSSFPLKYIPALIVALILIGGLVLAVVLAGQKQDVRSDASQEDVSNEDIQFISESLLSEMQNQTGNTVLDCTYRAYTNSTCSGNPVWSNRYIHSADISEDCTAIPGSEFFYTRSCVDPSAESCQAPEYCSIGAIVCCGGSTPIATGSCDGGYRCPAAYSKKIQYMVRGKFLWRRDYNFGGWNDWQKVSDNIATIGTGQITSFLTAQVAPGKKMQYLTRGGKIWLNDRIGTNPSWNEITDSLNLAGKGKITSFSSTRHPQNYLVQYAVRGGKIWSRSNMSNGWNGWTDETMTYGGVGSGPIKSFNQTWNTNGRLIQHMVRGNQVWSRSFGAIWTDWTSETSNLNGVGQGLIISLMTDSVE